MKKIALAVLAVICSVSFSAATCAAEAPNQQKQFAFDVIDRNADQIALVGDSLFYFGELGMQEYESAKFLKETLQGAGFNVESNVAGMPTALWAKWGSGKPYIVIVTEIDALPGGSQTPAEFQHKPLVNGAPGHMEGHNTHGGVALAAAFAVKQVMERYHIPGSVAISFGPAEEQLISRPYLVRAGYFKDVDAAIYLHVGDQLATGYGLANYAAISAKFTFHGKTAHGAVDPWDGKDALDAVELMDVGVAFLRQQLHPTYRAHRTITNGGIQPNVIPDLAQIWWFVRDANMPDARQTYDKLVNIAKGAALMTGTTEDVQVTAAAWPQLGNKAIAAAIQSNFNVVGMPKWSEEEQRFAKEFQRSAGRKEVGLRTTPTPFGTRPQSFASNDSGDVSWSVPAGLLSFPASVPGIQYHEWHAAVTPTSSIAHKGMVGGAKVLAASVLDLLALPELRQRAQAEFQQATKESRYFAVLPADAKPPLDLNRDTMEKFRPEMRKYYLNKKVEFK